MCGQGSFYTSSWLKEQHSADIQKLLTHISWLETLHGDTFYSSCISDHILGMLPVMILWKIPKIFFHQFLEVYLVIRILSLLFFFLLSFNLFLFISCPCDFLQVMFFLQFIAIICEIVVYNPDKNQIKYIFNDKVIVSPQTLPLCTWHLEH